MVYAERKSDLVCGICLKAVSPELLASLVSLSSLFYSVHVHGSTATSRGLPPRLLPIHPAKCLD